MNLYTTAYVEPDRTRRFELDQALNKNIESNLFDKIYVLIEGDKHPFVAVKDGTNLVFRFQNHRQMFVELFSWVNENTNSDTVSVVANSDIYFDDSLLLVETQEMVDTCFALSRWDVGTDGNSAHWVSIDSQDAWIFRGWIKQGALDNAYFGPGIAGCDNRLAAVLHEAGYDVRNPSRTIKAHHLHNSGVRNYVPSEKVMGEYFLIEPEYLDIQ